MLQVQRTIASLMRAAAILLAIACTAPAQTDPPDGAVLARAGDVFVAEREFTERFELTPGLYRHRKPQLEQEKLVLLYSMVAEKLLAREARERQFDTAGVYRAAITDLLKLLVRDELYRQEVSTKVRITPTELRTAIARARERRLIRFWYLPDSASAQFVRSRLRTGADLDRFAADTSLGAVIDTATVRWGDADEAIEEGAYTTAMNAVSPVIAAGDGYYLLRPLRREPDPAVQALPAATLRDRVASTLRMRKERVREAAFLEELLRRRPASSPPATYRPVADAIAQVFRERHVPPSTAFTPAMRDEVLARIGGVQDDTLIVAGPRIWTVREALDRLAERGFTVSGDSVRGVAARLYTVFREWTHHELLAQEGLARGLDVHPEVRRRLAPWADHYLAGMTQRAIHARVEVTDAEVYAYLRSTGTPAVVPEVRLRILRTSTLGEMEDVFAAMEGGESFAEVIRRRQASGVGTQDEGDTGFFPVTDRPPMGYIGARLEPGAFYGPFRDSTAFTYVQLIGQRNAGAAEDTTGAGRFAAAREELRRMKERRSVTLFLAKSAAARGVEIYTDRLQHLQVTPLAMVAYRILGFGGRMFEVPFVQPQLEWVDTEPEEGIILP